MALDEWETGPGCTLYGDALASHVHPELWTWHPTLAVSRDRALDGMPVQGYRHGTRTNREAARRWRAASAFLVL